MSDEGPGFPEPGAVVAPLLVVADLDRSLDFYRGLGATVVVRWDEYARLALAGGALHLATPTSGVEDRLSVDLAPPASIHLGTGEVVIDVADCHATYAALAARGVRFLAPPTEPSWGGEIRCFLQDPDGHLIELSQVLPSEDD
ncbi:MAG: VOC family protein [Chloroflexi bacterium]|nr:VOC family protein [Chloroflexota bacterium]